MLELGLVLRKVLEWIVQVRVYRSLVPNVPSTLTIQIRFLALAQDWDRTGAVEVRYTVLLGRS